LTKKKSLFARINEALGDVEEPSDEEIIRDVEASVEKIKQAKADILEAEKVLDGGWGEKGALVYIMNLRPIYEAIGTRTGRVAENLQGLCETTFAHKVPLEDGHASFRGDCFFMSFANTNQIECFHQAASIINKIGTSILCDRFKALEIQNFLMVAKAEDITSEDGSLSLRKAEIVIQDGGSPIVTTEELDDNASDWLKLLWSGLTQNSQVLAGDSGDPEEPEETLWQGQKYRSRKSTDWQTNRNERRKALEEARAGAERRTHEHGRRNSDNVSQAVW
jgi:hypothetical protein